MARKKPLGGSGIFWSPVLEGGVGYGTFENHISTGPLAGNDSTIETLAVFLGGGVRFTVWEYLSLAPTFGFIYAHSENDVDARTPAGEDVVRRAGGILNWSADTYTLVPGIELRYRQLFGPIQLTLKSAYKYFHTEPIERSTDALSFESSSQWWFNEIDVEWRMPLYLWGRQLRTGAYFARRRSPGGSRSPSEGPLQPGRRPIRDGRSGPLLAAGVRWHRRRLLLGRELLWLDHRRGDRLRVLVALTARVRCPAGGVLTSGHGPQPRPPSRLSLAFLACWR